jgi:hypothetical protein
MIQDKKTGEWYCPHEKMKELFQQPWFLAQMKRMANK